MPGPVQQGDATPGAPEAASAGAAPPSFARPAAAISGRCPRLWAWEFLRRNAEFAATLKHMAGQIEERGRCGQIRLLRAPAPGRRPAAGCLFASSVLQDGRTADVLWDPRDCPSVLHAMAVPAVSSGAMPSFSLESCPLPGLLLQEPGGTQHLLLRDGLRRLQLAISGASLLRPVHLVPAGPSDRKALAGQMRGWCALLDLQRTGRLPDQRPGGLRASRRLGQVLIALDGWRAGVPHREIAVVLFGQARVARDWADPHACLRDRVRRAVARGRFLSRTGYRKLLRSS